MDAWILPLALNVVLGLLAYLGKQQIDTLKQAILDLKAEHQRHRDDIQNVKQEYVNKDDFRDFKAELYNRLDKNHDDIIRQIAKGQ